MKAVRTQHKWGTFLKFYSEQNAGRKTRLGVFEETGGNVNDYWIEDGLLLHGIDIDASAEPPVIEIILAGYSHVVSDARRLKVHYSLDEDEDGLDIVGGDGKTTVLRFENI